jgi:hypothetical protein
VDVSPIVIQRHEIDSTNELASLLQTELDVALAQRADRDPCLFRVNLDRNGPSPRDVGFTPLASQSQKSQVVRLVPEVTWELAAYFDQRLSLARPRGSHCQHGDNYEVLTRKVRFPFHPP